MNQIVGAAAAVEPSIQERLFPDLTCFGCGPANSKGLRLRSYPGDGAVVATFQPWPEHDNGAGYLNGGIIATVLDCHGGAAVFDESARRAAAADDPRLMPYVTAGISVRYLRPCPMDQPLALAAVLTRADPEQMSVEVELAFEGRPRAVASALWKRWRPRGDGGSTA